MSLFGTILKVGAAFVDAAMQDTQAKNVQQTEEYQEEFNNYIEEFNDLSDVILLLKFHEEYADGRSGEGVFTMGSYSRMDPKFMAYMEVFKQRNISRKEVRCNDDECDRLVGYRMLPEDFSVIASEYDLTHGYCICDRCGKELRWEVSFSGFSNSSEIYVYDGY